MLRFVPEKPAETTVPFRSFVNETHPKSSRYASFRKFVAHRERRTSDKSENRSFEASWPAHDKTVRIPAIHENPQTKKQTSVTSLRTSPPTNGFCKSSFIISIISYLLKLNSRRRRTLNNCMNTIIIYGMIRQITHRSESTLFTCLGYPLLKFRPPPDRIGPCALTAPVRKW